MAAVQAFWSKRVQDAIDFAEEEERREREIEALQAREKEILSNGGARTPEELERLRALARDDRRKCLARDMPQPAPGEVSREFVAQAERTLLEPGRKILAMRRVPDADVPLSDLLEDQCREGLGLGGMALTSDLADAFEQAAYDAGSDTVIPLLLMPPLAECMIMVRPTLEAASTDYLDAATRDRLLHHLRMPEEMMENALLNIIHFSTLDPGVLDTLTLQPKKKKEEEEEEKKPRFLEDRRALLEPIRLWRSGRTAEARDAARAPAVGLDEASIERLEEHVLATTLAPHGDTFGALEFAIFHPPSDKIAETNGLALTTRDLGRVGALRVALPMAVASGAHIKSAMAQQIFYALKRMLGATGETVRLPPLVVPPERPFALSPTAPNSLAAQSTEDMAYMTLDPHCIRMRDPQLVLEYWSEADKDLPGVVTLYVRWTTRREAENRRLPFADFLDEKTRRRHWTETAMHLYKR